MNAVIRFCVRTLRWLGRLPGLRVAVQACESALNRPCAAHAHKGHPRWHLLFPKYHRYARRSLHFGCHRDGEASKFWRNKEHFRVRGYSEIEQSYRRARGKPNEPYGDIIEVARPWLTERILDIGCGSGHFLRALVDHGYPLENCFGCDLHAVRVDAARRLVFQGAVQSALAVTGTCDDNALLATTFQHIFVFDLLADDLFPETAQSPDVVTLLALTPVFEDDRLASVGRKIADLAPKTIIDVSAHDHTHHNIGGRENLEEFFPSYRQTATLWRYEKFFMGAVRYLWTDREIWSTRRIAVLEREERG